MPEREFDPTTALRTLASRDVDFVVIGNVAAAMHGSTYGTTDLDIVVRPAAANRKRLASTTRCASRASTLSSP